MCKQRVIASWESVCSNCWAKLEEHDVCPMCLGHGSIPETNTNGGFTLIRECPECDGSGYTGKWRQQMILLNHCREFLRDCGVDLTELHKLW